MHPDVTCDVGHFANIIICILQIVYCEFVIRMKYRRNPTRPFNYLNDFFSLLYFVFLYADLHNIHILSIEIVAKNHYLILCLLFNFNFIGYFKIRCWYINSNKNEVVKSYPKTI